MADNGSENTTKRIVACKTTVDKLSNKINSLNGYISDTDITSITGPDSYDIVNVADEDTVNAMIDTLDSKPRIEAYSGETTIEPSTTGKTIPINIYTKEPITISPVTGTAKPENVLTGYSFNSSSGININGTMVNQGAKTSTLSKRLLTKPSKKHKAAKREPILNSRRTKSLDSPNCSLSQAIFSLNK